MLPNIEERLVLDQFELRPYQEELWDAVENHGYKKVLAIWPRRSGKDVSTFNLAIRWCLRRTTSVFYCLPTYGQARKCIWDAILIDGTKLLDMIPKSLILRINQSEMQIVFKNNSILQLIGADSYATSLVGCNPSLIVFSEWARCTEEAYSFARPILAANPIGTVIFLTTPLGKNHAWRMFETVKELPEWFVSLKKTSEIEHIPEEALEQEREQMSPELFAQEFECSFSRGQEGCVFGYDLEKMKQENRVTFLAYEPQMLTHLSIDIGVNDNTTIIWFQTTADNSLIKIIDCYSNRGLGLDHYADIIQRKPYWARMGKLLAPFDLKVREWGGGAVTRYEKARQLGLNFTVLDQLDLEDSIENTKTHFPKIWIDKTNCASLVDALENYYREWDEKKQDYKREPVHNWASHYCFTGDTKVLTRNGMREIINILEGDEVLTLEGWQKCSNARLMRTNAQLVEITFQDGTKVRCTPDHMFLMENGWRSAEHLLPYSEIRSSLMQEPNTLMVNSTDSMDILNTIKREVAHYIEMSGLMLSDLYQKVVIFIISILIPRIINSTIYNVSQHQNIERYLGQITKVLVKNAEMQQLHGMLLKLGICGIRDWHYEQEIGKNGSVKNDHVFNVKSYSTVLSEQMDVNRSSAIPTVKPCIIEKVESLHYLEDVYCITVPDAGHFSLSNGAIVKNCDAFRYMCQGLHKTKKGLTPEDFEKAKAKALYGGNPSFNNMVPRR